ncbi:MAG: hypothetical protein LBJ17_05250 [Dysgonamonadaceae bacterium]|jgi:hypothetical protein|nr:hypothetical protein [Dysgonamonadaceae bacterium]
MAYHPTKPVSPITDWDGDYTYQNTSFDTWKEINAANAVNRLETCPVGWRRFMIGDTTSLHNTQFASGSELMQSLFYTTVNNINSNAHDTNYRYLGYYADGYFDRRAIVNGVGDSRLSNSAVSVSTKDAAYIGTLFFNAASGASLFMPAGGHRNALGQLYYSGNQGFYYNSSAFDATAGGGLVLSKSEVYQISYNRPFGLAVRCVKEDLVQ